MRAGTAKCPADGAGTVVPKPFRRRRQMRPLSLFGAASAVADAVPRPLMMHQSCWLSKRD